MTVLTLHSRGGLARLVHPSNVERHTGVVASELLHEIAAGLAPWALSIHHTVPGNPATRRYARLLETPAYEAWIIVWPPATGLDLHDHGESAGVLRVVSGELVETYTDREQPGPLRVQRLSPGDAVTVAPTRVHDVRNESAATAVTVHVYSPRLSTMTFYDALPGRYLDPVRAENATAP